MAPRLCDAVDAWCPKTWRPYTLSLYEIVAHPTGGNDRKVREGVPPRWILILRGITVRRFGVERRPDKNWLRFAKWRRPYVASATVLVFPIHGPPNERNC